MSAPDRIWAFGRQNKLTSEHIAMCSVWAAHPNAAMADCYLLATPARLRAEELLDLLTWWSRYEDGEDNTFLRMKTEALLEQIEKETEGLKTKAAKERDDG